MHDAKVSARHGIHAADLETGYPINELGPLPAEWGTVTLGHLVNSGDILVKNGFAEGRHNQTGEGVPHLRPFNVSTDGRIDLTQIKSVSPPPEDSPYWVRRGDVIFNNTNSEELVGKTAFFAKDGKFVLSNHMTLLRVVKPDAVDAYWLARELHYLWQSSVFRAVCRRHVNQASVSLERLKAVLLPIPPLPEQRAIANVLLIVQRAKEATETVIAATRDLKKSLMRHLFTYGPVPVEEADRVPLKETEVGLVPSTWDIVRLSAVTRSIMFGPRFSAELYHPSGNAAALRTTDIDDDGRINFPTMPRASLDATKFQHHFLLAGDVLVTRSGTIGIAAVFESQPIPVVAAAFTIRLRPNERVMPIFLRYYLNSGLGRSRVVMLASGAVQKNITGTALSNLCIPLPPVGTQREIVRRLCAIDRKTEAEKARKQALDTLFQTLLHHLMTGKLRVKDMRLDIP